MNKIIFYDEINDILSIHKGFLKDEKFKGNIDIGDLILDLSTKSRIRGLEIINATTFFKEFEINKSILKNIEEAQFNAHIKPSGILISITIKAKNIENEIPAKIAVPLKRQLR